MSLPSDSGHAARSQHFTSSAFYPPLWERHGTTPQLERHARASDKAMVTLRSGF
ncbi:hypothetical protein [Salinibacterium sp. NK8237]|uniref:hypothetical protein n=1 Tax=Salinibacterium sp. NK8237 TaxID=2792038 RepID=UPI0018CF0DC4|nr:hypothetical protein [Salinibacterium sp. NK8237]MBH0129698.1 hypothetical protein [Salinibacterium sp. NK8237]